MNDLPSLLPDPLDPGEMERTFRRLRGKDEIEAFSQAVQARYARESDNLLLAAWYHRLTYAGEAVKQRVIAWQWAVPLAVLNGLIFWLLSDERFMFEAPDGYDYLPWLLVYWMPIAATFILIYLTATGEGRWRRALVNIGGLGVLSLYVYGAYRQMIPRVAVEQYLGLAAVHLPILAWGAIGLLVLAGRNDAENRFALLLKMLETVVLAGLFVLVGGVFVGITAGLFSVLSVQLPDWVLRLLAAGGAGLIPLAATAILYDPGRPPAAQSFDDGLSKTIALLLRLVLPLSLIVLVVYLAFIPFNFRAPLTNREVLIIYNVMLFAVMALLLGVTPARPADLSASRQRWLRRGVTALAALTAVVGVYALWAIAYRTWHGALTPNRLAFMGWNVINLGLLGYLLVGQWRAAEEAWLPALKRTFAHGAILYVGWALFVVLTTPWLFGRFPDPAFADLPPYIRRAVYGETYPILLKCDSPHIYVLEHGQKRWIKDIPTFEQQGYKWRDVRFVSCEDLRRIPDGPPIPPDAGTPPVPYSPYGPQPTATLPPPTTQP
ncbi:MAG TPA: hypothetical protein ENJ31_11585 [Anaerolineae bacterium]|nr:hypothetical protein [Anaerolineae bacterium]